MSQAGARLDEELTALRTGSGIGSIGPRRQIAVAGKDRAAYLQGLLTNDIQALAAGSGCYAAWLTPQGRMLTDMHVLESGDMILLDVPAESAEATVERLEQFIFTEDVQVSPLDGQLTGVWVHGPSAAAALEATVSGLESVATWPDYRVTRASLGEVPVVVARIDQLGVPGFCAYLPPDMEERLRVGLSHAGAVPVSQRAIDAVRIEAGYPLFGADMTDDTIPLEAGIEGRAISFSKGCYVGQEVIIRVLHRGHGRVARRLVGLRVQGEAAAGSKLAAGDREVGFVTSIAMSPTLGWIALGYVHRDFVEPGTALQVRAGDILVSATVDNRTGRSDPSGLT
jgi:folate-binding protein YgfZ